MKKIATATIATAGFATIAIASGNQAHASEQITTVIIQTTQHHIAILTLLMHKVTTITHGKVTGIQVN